MAALAPLTERVRLGHLVTANAMRHPALLAKMATGVDVISNGRVNLGIGSGSVALEHEQLGIPFPRAAQRSKQLAETVEIIKTMFTQAVTSFEGEFYHVRDVPNLPQPVQQPNPPIVIGGGGEKFTLPIVARWADVWNCPTYDLAVLEHKIERLRGLCEAIGRDFSTLVLGEQAVLTLVARRADLDAGQEEARRRYGGGFAPQDGFVGTPEDVIRQLRAKVDLGMRQFAFFSMTAARPRRWSCLPGRCCRPLPDGDGATGGLPCGGWRGPMRRFPTIGDGLRGPSSARRNATCRLRRSSPGPIPAGLSRCGTRRCRVPSSWAGRTRRPRTWCRCVPGPWRPRGRQPSRLDQIRLREASAAQMA